MADAEASAVPNTDGAMFIKIQLQDGELLEFKVKKSTKISKIFRVFCERKELDLKTVKFLFDGARLSNEGDQTVASLGLEDGDAIDCVMGQNGGALAGCSTIRLHRAGAAGDGGAPSE